MKRCINSIQTIEVVIHSETILPDNYVAAETYLKHPRSIRKDKKISDKHLGLLNDIIASFDNTLKYYHFPILKKYAANNSYSYYIQFEPITYAGEHLAPIRLIFRVSNHVSRSAKGDISSPTTRIVQFTLNDESFDNSLDLIVRGSEICKQLYEGNKRVLDEI